MMYLEHLSLINYRNIAECDLRFSPKFNCFLGNNGMGKTNLLDAVYYLSFTKSHLNPVDSQLIRYGEEFFMMQAEYVLHGGREEIFASVKRRAKKVFKRNKVSYERMSDHIGLLPAVLVSPSDSELIEEGSDGRRRFLDTVISQYDRMYINALAMYNKALAERNALLKQEAEPDAAMMDVYEGQMAYYGDYICRRRSEFVAGFIPEFQRFYTAISGGTESVELSYVSHWQRGDLAQLLAECRMRDRILGYSTRGAHKDDMEMLLDGYPIKRAGSQGQCKSYIVALKFAQYACLRRTAGVEPLLLLDDLFDKLDAVRVKRIMEIVAGEGFGQVFITDTNREHTDALLAQTGAESRIFHVENGHVI